jgi:purine catabolism regulator
MMVRIPEKTEASDIARYSRARDSVVAISNALADIKTPGLIGILDPQTIAIFLTTSSSQSHSVDAFLDSVAKAIRRRAKRSLPENRIVIGVGSSAGSIDELRRSFAEAEEAADASLKLPEDKSYATPADIHLRGLIYLLRDNQHLQRYAERELGVLMAYDKGHNTNLIRSLTAYLETGGNKSLAANRANVSRAAMYNHLKKVERILHCSLDNPDWVYSLYVALLACESLS